MENSKYTQGKFVALKMSNGIFIECENKDGEEVNRVNICKMYGEEEIDKLDAGRIVHCVNNFDALVEALDMVTRVFIYSQKKEFHADTKIRATELAVQALLSVGVNRIGETFEP